MSEETRTRRPGKVSLHPLKFEDALKSLLKSKPSEKKQAAPGERKESEQVG